MPVRNQPLHLGFQATKNWVEDVLVFANLENPDDILIHLGVDAQGDWAEPDESTFIDVLYNFIGSFGPDGFGDSQAGLREVLNTLTEPGGPSKVDQLISDRIDSVDVQGAVTFKAGYLRFQSIGHFQSQDQWWAIGIARLLHAGMSDRLHQCDCEKCSVYFVDWPGRKGQKMRFCCPNHQKRERQRRSRARAKERRKKRNTPGLGGAI